MNSPLCKLKPLSFAMMLGLTACGSSGTSTPGAGAEVSGLVEAPNGQIALFKQNQSTLVALTEFVFPGAYAAITGLDPVTGATVELIRVDNNGDQIGDVLASTVTSITGNYNLSLPAGVDFSGDLVLRITGNGGAEMSAQVVEQSVDINPISQFILDKFIEDGTALATLAVNEVVALTGRVEEFDLTATADLSTMLAQLEAEVGQFVDNEITVITATPGNGAQAAGNWRIVDMSIGFHDSDGQGVGTFGVDVETESIQIADNSSGNIDIIISGEEGAFTNFQASQSGVNLYYETFMDSRNDTLGGTIDDNGNIAIPFPFEEELQTVDLQQDPDGPDFGWRYPPGIFFVNGTGNDNIKFTVDTEASVRYATTDTNNDGVKDAVDPAARSGDEISLDMVFLLKEGSGMSTASLNGNYGMVSMQLELDAVLPRGKTISTKGIVNFDGAGTFDIQSNAINSQEIWREPNTTPPNAILTHYDVDDAGTTNTAYTVSSTGAVDIPGAGFQGFSSAGGMLIASIDSASTDDGSGPPPVIETVDNSLHLMTKLGSGIVAADIANATYKIQSLLLGGGPSGFQILSNLSSDSTIAFNATATSATIDASDRGIERASDTAEVMAIIDEAEPAMVIPVTGLGSSGAITMVDNSGDENILIDGYLSADKNLLIMRAYIEDTIGGDKDLGLIIGIKQ